MEQRTFEGSWEEIAQHGAQFVGRKVRVTILDGEPSRVMLDSALAHLIKDAERLSESLPSVPQSSSTDAWSLGVVEKFRRQGFNL